MATVITKLQQPEIPPGERQTPFRWSIVLLLLLVVMASAIELGSRTLVPRTSRIMKRIVSEYSEAIAPPPADGRPVVLFTGNSLLKLAVQFDRLKQEFASGYDMRRLVVENTFYNDWRYGFNRLYADGARPKVVVLALNSDHLALAGSRGEFSAYFLTTRNDVLGLCRDLNLHPTNVASMVFANYSMFYAMRSELRNVVLGKIMPDLPELTNGLTVQAAPPISDEKLRVTIRERARVLRDELARHGTQLVLAFPPNIGSHHQLTIAKAAAAESGVEALLPFQAADYVPRDFSDGFHLNDDAAERFTSQLIAALRTTSKSWR